MLNWPGTDIINALVEEFPENPEGFVGERILPLNVFDYLENTGVIKWDILGPALGMVPAHALNTDPALMTYPVLKTKTMPTAYWKGMHRIGESEILNSRKPGTLAERYSRGLVVKGLETIRTQVRARLEWLRWQCLQGSVAVDENGVKFTMDYEVPSANKINVSSASGYGGQYWSTVASADPIHDLQKASELYRGSGAGKPVAYFNRKVAGYLSQNAKVRDLVKQSTVVTGTGVENIGQLLLPLVGDLGGMEIYDKGYRAANGTWTPYIPDNKLILVGQGPANELVGEFASTPNLHNGGMDAQAGEFYVPIDKTAEPNPYYDILGGIYGMPVLKRPNWIVILTVAA